MSSASQVKNDLPRVDASAPSPAEFRASGFTEAAINYPLSDRAFGWLCKFNGIATDRAPRSWRYAPNPTMQAWLDRAGATPGFTGGPLPGDGAGRDPRPLAEPDAVPGTDP